MVNLLNTILKHLVRVTMNLFLFLYMIADSTLTLHCNN